MGLGAVGINNAESSVLAGIGLIFWGQKLWGVWGLQNEWGIWRTPSIFMTEVRYENDQACRCLNSWDYLYSFSSLIYCMY